MKYELGEHRPKLIGDNQWIAPDAAIIGNVELHEHSSVWFGSVIRGDMDLITVGARSNIQDHSVLHTDAGITLTIGSHVTVGHRVMLHGCQVGDNSLIGIGSTVLNNAVIGANSLVGAHSLVTEGKQFPDGVLLMGSPAKVVRELSDAEIQFITASAEHYVANAAAFATNLKRID